MKIIFFNNGVTVCLNDNGEQVPNLQKPWFETFLNFIESQMVVDIDKIEFYLPAGKAWAFKSTLGHWNWSLEDSNKDEE